MKMGGSVVLIDLPTFPKGILSLSLVNVATSLSEVFEIEIIDLNFHENSFLTCKVFTDLKFWGLKVSSQNFDIAKQLTSDLKNLYPSVKVVWGGELPTLLPNECLNYADTIVGGLFEPVANEFITDLQQNSLKPKYFGGNEMPDNFVPVPNFNLLKSDIHRYHSFIGLPMETSRGCTEKCIFCMVHIMQKKNYLTKKNAVLKNTAEQYRGHFVNIIDYNFGVDREHVINVAGILKESGVKGWMAEMCIEFLDDDELLKALRASGCRMIYCGLETIDEAALATVHKMNTNHVHNYERIIRKAQNFGIQIAAGIILGLENMNEKTFEDLYLYFSKMGLIYAKLTFLTYNPGTKVKEYMKKRGTFLTENVNKYDGNHLTYLPLGLQAKDIYTGAENFIIKFYSLKSIIKRSFNTPLTFSRRIEFIFFNLCYRNAYFDWIRMDIFDKDENFERLLQNRLNKSPSIRLYESVLSFFRKW